MELNKGVMIQTCKDWISITFMLMKNQKGLFFFFFLQNIFGQNLPVMYKEQQQQVMISPVY